MVIEFPKKDVISQEELRPIFAAEGQVDVMLEVVYKRHEAGAIIEHGPLKLNMRRRPIRAVEEKEGPGGDSDALRCRDCEDQPENILPIAVVSLGGM